MGGVEREEKRGGLAGKGEGKRNERIEKGRKGRERGGIDGKWGIEHEGKGRLVTYVVFICMCM